MECSGPGHATCDSTFSAKRKRKESVIKAKAVPMLEQSKGVGDGVRDGRDCVHSSKVGLQPRSQEGSFQRMPTILHMGAPFTWVAGVAFKPSAKPLYLYVLMRGMIVLGPLTDILDSQEQGPSKALVQDMHMHELAAFLGDGPMKHHPVVG